MVTAAPALDGTRDRFGLAVLGAAAIHALLIFGVTFQSMSARNNARQLEVTLVQTATARPLQASHIAQANQLGSGNDAAREQAPRANPSLPVPTRVEQEQQASAGGAYRPAALEKTITTTRNSEYVAAQSEARSGSRPLTEAEEKLQRLNERLAVLEASLQNQDEAASSQPRVRRITSVSARSAVDAAYLQEWRRRLETVGNTYYPRASLRYGLYGSLRLLVVIRKDGSLESVNMLSSSGYAVLDEAAVKIVRLAAPYAAFPPELAATTDKLEIVRTWQFEQNDAG